MASKYIKKYPIPEDFPELLHDFAKEVVRNKPKDILNFGIEYFKALQNKNSFDYENSRKSNKESDSNASPIVLNEDTLGKVNESGESVDKINAEQFIDNVFRESKDFIQRKEQIDISDIKEQSSKLKAKESHHTESNEEQEEKTITQNCANTMTNEVAAAFIDDVIQKSTETVENNVNNTV